MPYSVSLEELNRMLGEKNLTVVDDPYIRHVNENDLSPKEIAIRDRAFKAIENIVNDWDVYHPVLRLKLVKAARKKFKISKPTLYKWLKKYWRNGLNLNALLPDFDRCGAPNKERKSGTLDAVRAIARKGFKEFVVNTGGDYSIENARIKTNTKYKSELGGKKIQYHIFYLFGRCAFPDAPLRKAKVGDKKFDANERLLHGRSNDIVNGPCKLYQIDSTWRDIRIVSSLNPNQYIGRPTFYVVQDSWTRAVVGVLITLDNPSYIAAAHALFISFRSKEMLIQELNLGLEHLGWSNSFIPEELVADRAEFLGPKSDQIVKNLGIRLGNTAAYRPDLKGAVEKIIDLIQERARHLFEGKGQVSKEDGERTAKDTRLEATVTLEELYQITWIVVNEHNNFHWIDEYPLTSEMVRDGVKKIPAEIHKWGIEQNRGTERTRDEKTLWFNLMESKDVIPSRKGIRLNKQDYVPADEKGFAILENLICAPSVKAVQIIYDPRVYKNIYWVYNESFIKLRLRGKDDAQFTNEWEAVSNNETYNELKKESRELEEDQKVRNDSEIETIISKNREDQAKKKIVVSGSKSAKSLEREFNRAGINNVPGEQNENKPTAADRPAVKRKQTKLLTKLKKVNG